MKSFILSVVVGVCSLALLETTALAGHGGSHSRPAPQRPSHSGQRPSTYRPTKGHNTYRPTKGKNTYRPIKGHHHHHGHGHYRSRQGNWQNDSGDDGDGADQPATQDRRFLRIKNATGQTLKVFVQYYTLTDQDDFQWLPGDPESSNQVVLFTIEPDQLVNLNHGKFRINASRVRLWATSESSNWLQYKDKDLWLVPEQDDNGDHYYTADQMGTFTFTFNP